MIGRRRFISIVAGAGLAGAGLSGYVGNAVAAVSSSTNVYRWKGIALGAAASLSIVHSEGPALAAQVHAEIKRLERIFSLYRTDSALFRLNTEGYLKDPPFELLELLTICDHLHAITEGAFDPTVQPLWQLYARKSAAGGAPSKSEIADTMKHVGWKKLHVEPDELTFETNDGGLTLNGIAQGYITDKVAQLLKRAGVSDVLVNMGEIAAVGFQPDGKPWRVGISDPANPTQPRAFKNLTDMAIATSAPLGTVFDQQGAVGHILDPRTGHPGGKWQQVSVMAPEASRADGLSTAFCLMEKDEINQVSAGIKVELLA